MSPLARTWRQRALVTALTRRELSARYRGGVLGFFWSLLNPLLLLLVYATVFRLVFRPRSDVRPYAVCLLAGLRFARTDRSYARRRLRRRSSRRLQRERGSRTWSLPCPCWRPRSWSRRRRGA